MTAEDWVPWRPLNAREHYERNLEIVAMRDAGATLEAVGVAFDLSRERVRQIEAREHARRRHPTDRWPFERALYIAALMMGWEQRYERARNLLIRNGLTDPIVIRSTPDSDLLAIRELGVGTLELIRAAYPSSPSTRG